MNAQFTAVRKICQMTGEWDRQLNQPVLNRTDSRFGIFGTDLGSSFEHNGRLWFLFGDTWPSQAHITGAAAVSRYADHMELFYFTGSGIVNAMPSLNNRWFDPFPICGARFSQSTHLAAVSRDPKHMEVFAVGEDGIMRGRWFWEDTWHDWYVLGAARFSQTASVAAVSRDPKHMEVFAIGEDGKVRGRWFWEDTWHDWYVLGEQQFTQDAGLAAVSRARGLMDVFGIRDDGNPWSTWFRDPKWNEWNFIQSLTDSVAWTTSRRPGPHLALNFVSTTCEYARYRSPQLVGLSGELVNTGAFSVPISGFSAGGKMYVFYSEYAEQVVMGRTYLSVADGDDPTRLRALYVVSVANMTPALDGHFINIACKVVPHQHPSLNGSLPFSGPALLLWGSGRYRNSHVYLAAVPLANVESRSAWWFYTGSPSSPWSPDEHQARPLFEGERIVGELSITWIDSLRVWLMLYNGETPILGRIALAPWGPWSDVQTVYETETALGQFVHRANSGDMLSDPGRESAGGGLYGGYLIDRFTHPIDSTTAQFYFLMSTWNPYNTVLMTGTLTMI